MLASQSWMLSSSSKEMQQILCVFLTIHDPGDRDPTSGSGHVCMCACVPLLVSSLFTHISFRDALGFFLYAFTYMQKKEIFSKLSLFIGPLIWKGPFASCGMIIGSPCFASSSLPVSSSFAVSSLPISLNFPVS